MNRKKFLKSILAGIFVGLAATVYLKVGGVVGAILFAFGLLCVVHFKTPLFTGQAGFVQDIKDLRNLLYIIIGNIIGCFLVSLLPITGIDATSIIESRISSGYFNCFLLAIGCGFIMTIIVKAARDGNIIPLLFGIPVFILIGFYHSIADIFYIFESSIVDYIEYICIVIGNFVGCNIPRILKFDK